MPDFWLQCISCGSTQPPDAPHRCVICADELCVRYAGERPQEVDGFRLRGQWRHLHRLPVRARQSVVSLGEGDTPLVALSERVRSSLGVARITAKAEHRNPTGSFKDRIASVATSIAVERGLLGCIGTSSGNGGAAAAAYAAASGLSALLFTRPDIVDGKLVEILAYGGIVYRVPDLRSGQATLPGLMASLDQVATTHGYVPFLTCFRFSPEIMEGAKTIAFELAETAPWATAVYVPVGGGGLLSSIHKGYSELAAEQTAGNRRPRLVGVQPRGCQTLLPALAGRSPTLAGPLATTVSGLQVEVLLDAKGATAAVRETAGHAVEVSDEDIWRAQAVLAAEGLLVEPAGATAFAGVLADAAEGRLGPDDSIVVVLSGAGHKDWEALHRLARTARAGEVGAGDIPALLEARLTAPRTPVRPVGRHRDG